MTQILFTPLAKQDLQEIWLCLAENGNSEIAKKFPSAVKKKCETVSKFPEMGQVRHEYLLHLRSFPFNKYVIFYLPIEDGIEVLRIVHSSRDIQQIFDEMIPLEP